MHEDGCPLCGKGVVGRTALIGHLEFGHDIDAPEAYLEQLLRPAEVKRSFRPGPGLRRAGAAIAVLALAGSGLLGYQRLVVEGAADVAAAGRGVATTSTTTPLAPPTTATSTTTTEAPPATTTTAAPTTTAPPTTTTAAPPTTEVATAAPSTDVEFRRPFLLDAAHEGCEVQGAEAVHSVSFRFSGSRNITFDGRFYPERTGDRSHRTTRAIPAGSRAYLDHVVVLDPAGEAHQVEITPPVYLAGCSAGPG